MVKALIVLAFFAAMPLVQSAEARQKCAAGQIFRVSQGACGSKAAFVKQFGRGRATRLSSIASPTAGATKLERNNAQPEAPGNLDAGAQSRADAAAKLIQPSLAEATPTATPEPAAPAPVGPVVDSPYGALRSVYGFR